MAKSQIAEAASTAVDIAKSQTNLAIQSEDFAAMPSGLENVKAKDMVIPRLTILEGLSPQLDKNKAEYIKGAESGDFCDIATGEVWKESLKIIPVYFATVYLEWSAQRGKGLIKNYGMDASCLTKCTPNDRGQMVTKEGNFIAETATYFVLNLLAGGRRSFIPLSSTRLKASRKWMTLIMNQKLPRAGGGEFTPPIFYRSWNVASVSESNEKGSWHTWKFEPAESIIELDASRSLLLEAQTFNKEASEGLVQGDIGSYAEEASTEATNDPNAKM